MKKIYIAVCSLLLVVLMFLSFNSFGQVTVEGRVTDAVSGKPLRKMTVQLVSSSGMQMLAVTDSTGRFSFGQVMDSSIAGWYLLPVAHNYTNKKTRVRYWRGHPYYSRLSNTDSLKSKKYDFKLARREGIPYLHDLRFKPGTADVEPYDSGMDTVHLRLCAELIRDMLEATQSVSIEVQGYSEDKEGYQLAEQRVSVVRDYLESKKMDISRISLKAYGNSLPDDKPVMAMLKENTTGEAEMYVMNRRVAFKVMVDSVMLKEEERRKRLVFNLEGLVTDCNNKNVTIQLLGSDGFAQETKTDKAGYYSFSLKPGLSYVITTDARSASKTNYAERYLNSSEKGKVSTVNEKEAKIFKKDFCLTPAIVCYGFPYVLFGFNSVSYSTKSTNNEYAYNGYEPHDTSLTFLVETLKDNPTIVMEVSAHCDSREAKPEKLSEQRAQKIVNELIKLGIPKERLVARGYGSRKLLIKNTDIQKLKIKEEQEAAHQKNRRVVFKVLRWNYAQNAPPPPVKAKVMENKERKNGVIE
jgi:outer membrane protein OmpA-like peptidoglycan-associated protein